MKRNVLIEQTAGELAAIFYEAARSSGLKSKHKNARNYAKTNLEKFIPKAVELLLSMLQMNHISDVLKNEIYEALIERANDPDLEVLNQTEKKPYSIPDFPEYMFNKQNKSPPIIATKRFSKGH